MSGTLARLSDVLALDAEAEVKISSISKLLLISAAVRRELELRVSASHGPLMTMVRLEYPLPETSSP